MRIRTSSVARLFNLTSRCPRRVRASLGAILLSVVVAAGAYPEGAPWGAANPEADESCDSCHYDYDPVHASAALTVDGLPAFAIEGQEYRLTVRFSGDEAISSGFQLMAEGADAQGGTFRSEDDDIESIGSAARSTATRLQDDGLEWTLWWRAPNATDTLRFFVAASSANDDQSPFGDTIHYRQYDVAVSREGDSSE